MHSYVQKLATKRKKQTTAGESYIKPAQLLKLIDRYLQHKKDLDEIDDKIRAGEMTKKQAVAAEEVKSKLQKKKDAIDVEKTRVLNSIIFPAMANLTVLLEQMREHPNISKVFEDDIKELFLQASGNKPGWTIFHRFVEACVCKWNRSKQPKPEDSAALGPDFRAILGEYMQRAVFEMMKEMMSLKFEDAYFREKIIVEDMTRPIVWSKYFAAEAHRNLNQNLLLGKDGMLSGEHRRPASF